ncbi:MAG: glycosyl transferase [Clostridiales bacterium]|nr:glycosyl transferase [Clostridiales bacterium]
MKILVLSCSTGEGHNAAARALIEAAELRGDRADLRDPVSFGGERARRAVAGAYNGMIRRTPVLFGAVYGIGDLVDRTNLTSPIYLANALYAEKLSREIVREGYDAVISTHLYGAEAMTAVRRREGNPIPSYCVLTDYTIIPFFTEPDADALFLPHADLIAEGIEKGAAPEKLIPTGIPVSPRFPSPVSREEARDQLGIPREARVYLCMSGGVGCGNMNRLCQELTKAEDGGDWRVYVLTGRNAGMREAIEERFPGGRVTAVPFTKEVPLWMRASDAVISKAGGLSSTEAAVAGVPLVHLMTIPGCETKNAAFFEARGMSRRTKSESEAAEAAISLAEDAAAAEAMRKAQRQNIPPDAAERILAYVADHL